MEFATVDTPTGPFTIIVDGGANVLASGFTADTANLLGLIHPSLRPTDPLRRQADLGGVTKAVQRYFDGEITALDEVIVVQQSGEFLTEAWRALRTVTTPISYAQFAALSGRPAAVRAAAQACARNAAALFVPCHRVLRSDGSLGGFRWGLTVKRNLIDHEAFIGH